ncbi:hypothetical protein [Bradyrhizobium sp. CCBAU 51765]|uniref:hypothetical protein n=1 Tax=Bradyrhizobium sp. CCBAU 51765 TaxID=1325102 RepID=UPI0018879F6E|nr:hypothetical protein [Bradyrhizobium sp. CCBAU 51765]
MDAGLTLWGLYIPVDVLLTSIALYVVVSITLIIFVPVYAVPLHRAVGEDGRLIPIPAEDLGKIIEMRSKVRSAVLQTLGGLAVFGTVITSLQGIRGTEDAFNQKKAELFASARAGSEPAVASVASSGLIFDAHCQTPTVSETNSGSLTRPGQLRHVIDCGSLWWKAVQSSDKSRGEPLRAPRSVCRKQGSGSFLGCRVQT